MHISVSSVDITTSMLEMMMMMLLMMMIMMSLKQGTRLCPCYAHDTRTRNRCQKLIPEKRYTFLRHLTCNLVPNFSDGTSFLLEFSAPISGTCVMGITPLLQNSDEI